MPDEKEAVPDDIQIKLNFRVPSRMPSVYAHHMLIQPGENEVTLSFFEIMPPPVLPGQNVEERLKAVQESGIPAECVARVTIARAAFPGFAKAMYDMVEQYTAHEESNADSAKHNSES